MSIEVALTELAEAVGRRVGQPYLVSIRAGEDGARPHVVSVQPRLDPNGTVVVGAGRRTALNVAETPEVTLLWPVDEGDPKHSLLVDCSAAASDEEGELVLTPTSAILHRVRAAR